MQCKRGTASISLSVPKYGVREYTLLHTRIPIANGAGVLLSNTQLLTRASLLRQLCGPG